jgi:hypothetical protein
VARDDRPNAPGRGPAAYQPIEPLDEGTGVLPQPSARSSPPQLAPPAAQATDPRDEEQADPAVPAPVVAIAVRFASAAAALAFAGQMLSIGRADGLTFSSDDEQARWIRTQAELDIARELASAAQGLLFIEVAPGRLAEDHGWGAPPDAKVTRGSGAAFVDAGQLARASLAELVRIAGLRPVRERPVSTVHVMLPGAQFANAARRALDLRLDVAHRPVKLHPLFAGPEQQAAETVMLEMRLSAPQGSLPTSLLAALAREPRLTVCRPAGDGGMLLVQYGMATPLPDDLLAGLAEGEAWVLSNGQLGCQQLEPAGTFVDSASCVQLDDGIQLQSGTPTPDDRPDLPLLRIVRMRTYGRGVDAILLTSADLGAVALVLEGHSLSESAQLIRGRDRHLLVVAGGFLGQLPVGDALYRLGPGPLYLPLGYGMRPQLPASARRALFTADENTAVVLLPTVILKFDVTLREPVWRLWAGPLPEIDLQLPDDSISALHAQSTPAQAGSRPAAENDQASGVARTWLDAALEAEFRGELARAAELHERHGDPVRAARLYAKAAEETG